MPVLHPRHALRLLAAFLPLCAAAGAHAQAPIALTETADFTNTPTTTINVGFVGVGVNTITGNLFAMSNGTTVSGDQFDYIGFAVANNQALTDITITCTSMQAAGITSDSVSLHNATGTSLLSDQPIISLNPGAQTVAIQIPGNMLPPGSYVLGIRNGLTTADTGLRSFIYTVAMNAARRMVRVEGYGTLAADMDGSPSTIVPVGEIGEGVNVFAGNINGTIVTGDGFPTVSGDNIDVFSVLVPPAVAITSVSVEMSNLVDNVSNFCVDPGLYTSSGSVSPVTFTTNATLQALSTAPDGQLGPGLHQLYMTAGLSGACSNNSGVTSFSYVVRLTAAAQTPGACCNGWTGNCTMSTSAACASSGLTFLGASSACSPGVCAACPADFDRSGALALADIFTFLNAWFAGCP